MALINCKECGKEVSTEAAACPHCGAKPQKIPKKLGFPIAAIFIIAIFTLVNHQLSVPTKIDTMEVAGKIMATCQQRVLGRKQKEGERILSAQSSEIVKCMDEMGAAYIAGVKATNNQ